MSSSSWLVTGAGPSAAYSGPSARMPWLPTSSTPWSPAPSNPTSPTTPRSGTSPPGSASISPSASCSIALSSRTGSSSNSEREPDPRGDSRCRIPNSLHIPSVDLASRIPEPGPLPHLVLELQRPFLLHDFGLAGELPTDGLERFGQGSFRDLAEDLERLEGPVEVLD